MLPCYIRGGGFFILYKKILEKKFWKKNLYIYIYFSNNGSRIYSMNIINM